jgi:hypothetical protein
MKMATAEQASFCLVKFDAKKKMEKKHLAREKE